MSGAISALGKDNIVGVYSANDGLAAGIATALKAAGINVPLTGQDAQLDAIQRILLGTQTITVEKPYKPEADIAATMAVDLAEGKELPTPDAHHRHQRQRPEGPGQPADPDRGRQGQHQGHGRQGRSVHGPGDLHTHLRSRLQAGRSGVDEGPGALSEHPSSNATGAG